MKDNIKDGLCMASVLTGSLLIMGAEGGDKAGTLSPGASILLVLLGLALAAAPVLVCCLTDNADEYYVDDTAGDAEIDEERSDAA